MPKTTYAAHAALNAQYRNTAYTPPTTVYVALFTVMPTVSGGGTEVSGGSYVRQAVTFDPPVNQVITNQQVSYPVATADWGSILGYGYFDALSSGHLLSFNTLSAPRSILASDQFVFPAGYLSVQEL